MHCSFNVSVFWFVGWLKRMKKHKQATVLYSYHRLSRTFYCLYADVWVSSSPSVILIVLRPIADHWSLLLLLLLQSWSAVCMRSSLSSARSSISWPWRPWRWGVRPLWFSKSSLPPPTLWDNCRGSPSTTSLWYTNKKKISICPSHFTSSSRAVNTWSDGQ